MYKYLIITSVILFGFSCKKMKEEVVMWHQNGKPAIINFFDEADSTKQIKRQVKYYNNEQKEVEGDFENGLRSGHWIYYFENGQKWSEGEFKDGLSHGKFTVWQKDGKKYYEAEYKEGKPHGKWVFFNENKPYKEVEYNEGEVVKETIL